jgi:hypothetical protein
VILNQKNVHILSSQQPPYRVGVGAKAESSGIGEGVDYRVTDFACGPHLRLANPSRSKRPEGNLFKFSGNLKF